MKEIDLQKTHKTLLSYFITMIIITTAIVVLCEVGIFNWWKGTYAGAVNLEYITKSIMILLTLVSIPLSLKFFKIKFIRKKYDAADDRLQKYKELALIRLEVLILPMLLNTLLYYLFMSPSFGYMAIILLICLCFLTPSKSRIKQETESIVNP